MPDVTIVDHLAPLLEKPKGAVVDLWGVVHNGVAAFPEALDALTRFKAKGGRVVLLSNAPRPSGLVYLQLDRLGVPRNLYDAVVTSGDAARTALEAQGLGAVLHIGPERDRPLFDGLAMDLVETPESADLVVCTGLLDDDTETAETYRAQLEACQARGLTLVCANPDRIVMRGSKVIPCAGAVAKLYEALGGRVDWHGKPYPSVYDRSLAILGTLPAETIAIGDGIETDIPGANAQGIPAILVTGGVHAELWDDPPDGVRLGKVLDRHGLHVTAAIDRFRW